MEKITEFKSKYKYRIKVEDIDGVKYYTPQKAAYPKVDNIMYCVMTIDGGLRVPARIKDGRWESLPEDEWETDKWVDLPITSNDARDKSIAQEVIDHELLMEKRASGAFIKEYIEV